MESQVCRKCKFWIEEKTKRCPNCGEFYPTRPKSKIRTYAIKGAVIMVGIGFIFSLLLLIPKTNRGDMESIFGGMAFLSALLGSIIGVIIGIIYEGYLNACKVKYINLPYLSKDEQKLGQRQNDLNGKESKITESMRQLEQSFQLVEKPTEKFELAKKTLHHALDAIMQQKNEYKMKRWEIALIRWHNPLKPLTIKINSNKNPKQEQYDAYLKELEDIRNKGRVLLVDLQQLDISSKEKLQNYVSQLSNALEALNKLMTEVVERRTALDVQNAVKGVSFIKESPFTENPMIQSTVEQVSYLDALLPDLDTLSSDIEELEKEYFRLEAEKEVENSL